MTHWVLQLLTLVLLLFGPLGARCIVFEDSNDEKLWGLDIFAVQAFLAVAPCIAQHADYLEVLVTDLVHVKLRHWEVEMRHLAARGLGAHLEAAADLNMAPKIIKSLLDFCSHDAVEACLIDRSQFASWLGAWIQQLHFVVQVRHGAVIGLAQTLLALRGRSGLLLSDWGAAIARVVEDLIDAHPVSAKGCALTQAATCRWLLQ